MRTESKVEQATAQRALEFQRKNADLGTGLSFDDTSLRQPREHQSLLPVDVDLLCAGGGSADLRFLFKVQTSAAVQTPNVLSSLSHPLQQLGSLQRLLLKFF